MGRLRRVERCFLQGDDLRSGMPDPDRSGLVGYSALGLHRRSLAVLSMSLPTARTRNYHRGLITPQILAYTRNRRNDPVAVIPNFRIRQSKAADLPWLPRNTKAEVQALDLESSTTPRPPPPPVIPELNLSSANLCDLLRHS